MSVVLAIKDGDTIYVGTDSQVSCGGSKRAIANPNSFKIWRPAGHKHLVVGGTGALRDLNILSTVDVWFDEYEVIGAETQPFELTFSYVVRTLVPSIKAEIGKYASLEDFNSHFIFAYKDKCFEIHPCGAVDEYCFDGDFTAIGSGGTITKAVYSALKDLDCMSLEEKMTRSLIQACRDDLYVSLPIIMMNTKDEEVLVITEDPYQEKMFSNRLIEINEGTEEDKREIWTTYEEEIE